MDTCRKVRVLVDNDKQKRLEEAGFTVGDALQFLSCAEELQEILDFDVENAQEGDCVVMNWEYGSAREDGQYIRVIPLFGEPFSILKREARVLAARLLRAAAQ